MTATRPWLLLTPALLVFAGLLLWPLLRVVLFSLQDYGLREIRTGESNYIGVANYLEVLQDPQLWRVALVNTLGFAVVVVIATVVLGTLVAILMSRLSPTWRVVVGTAVMVAWAMPAVTGTYVWVWIFDADGGVVNQTLMALGLMETPVNWFTGRLTFYLIAGLNVVHHSFPFVAVTVLAGLLGCPRRCSKRVRWTAPVRCAGSSRSSFPRSGRSSWW